MASPALVAADTKTICTQPFVLRRLAVTTGATAGAVAHGLDRAPDAYWVQSTGTIDNSNEVTVTATSATEITLDCEDDGNNTIHVYVLLMDQGSGGYSDSAIPLTTP